MITTGLGLWVERGANVILRGLVLGTRLVLLVVLARLLEPADVGLYGLVAATVSFGILIIGGDFYTFSHRELLSGSHKNWWFVIQHHLIAISLLYVFVLPLAGTVFWLNLLPGWVGPFLFLILVGEHMAQELYRLLVVMGRQLIASVILVLRMAAWVWIFIPIIWFDIYPASLKALFVAWIAGLISAVAFGATIVIKDIPDRRLVGVDRRWLLQGFKIGAIFLAGTICLRLLFTLDRYLVEYFSAPDYLAVYVVYSGLAMTIQSVVDPAIFAFLYPRAVAEFRRGDVTAFKKSISRMMMAATVLAVLLAALIGTCGPLIMDWTGRPLYSANFATLWILLCASVVFVVSMAPHYELYARSLDRSILMAHLIGVLAFIVAVYVLQSAYHGRVVPIAVLVSMISIAAIKFAAVRLARLRAVKATSYELRNTG